VSRVGIRRHVGGAVVALALVPAGAVAALGYGRLVARASTSPRLVYSALADVDGDGRPDRVTLRTAAGGRLEVALRSGRVIVVNTHSDAPFLPGLVAVGNVDGRPGEELFVDVEHITTDELIAVYTYAAGGLRLAGTLSAYGEEYGLRSGITCSVRAGSHVITEHEFELQRSRRWTRRDTVYIWHGAVLRRSIRGQSVPIAGAPPASLTGVACGNAPVSARPRAHAAPVA
jgi:hypothetical protein